MSRQVAAVPRAVTPKPAFHAAHVPVAGPLALGVEEASPSGLPMRPCGAGQPRSPKSVPVTRTEEDKVRVIDAAGLGYPRLSVAMFPEVREVLL